MAPHQIARLGIGYCPEERGIFASLTCEENLQAAAGTAPGGMALDEIYELFPNLYERRHKPGHAALRRRAADAGGRPHPPDRRAPAAARRDSEGLAPVIVQTLARTVRMLREKGFTIVMVEQNSASPRRWRTSST